MPLPLWRFKELVRSMSLLSVLFSILPVRRVCLLLLLPAAALLLSAGVSQAQTAYGDYKVVGTGADAGISFEFLTTQPLLTPGLLTTFSFISCTVPADETCSDGAAQVGYSASGGQIRLTTTGANGQSRTWFFPSLLHTSVYIGKTGTGLEPGYVVVSGADATAGQPQSNATDSTFQFPLEVTVNDSTPSYQGGVTVTFTAPGSGPSASLPDSGQATTDATGRARITPTANGIPGAYQITATAGVGANTFQTSFVAANVNTANATGPCQVTTANDDFSVGSLRYQVAACGKGGTVTFASSINTVNVAAAQDIPLTQDLTIDGGSGVTINGNGLSRIFFVTGGTTTLRNLTLQNGGAGGGAGGVGDTASGGGAAGMGGAIFVNAGSLVINNVTFTGNEAAGGGGGPLLSGFFSGGGGGVGGPGGASASGINGNGGGGGDFGSSGGGGTGSSSNGSGDGAGGGNGGNGAFGGGGSGGGFGGTAGFAGGGGGGITDGGAGGTFGGSGGELSNTGGGGGAGLGGAIFMRNGTLSLTNATFSGNNAASGTGQSGGSDGQGKGGALCISSTASVVSTTALPAFSGNSADSAGTGTACNTVVGANALDTNDICGLLTGPATHFSLSAPASVTSYVDYSITVTALDANNNVVTGYTGTVHLTSTDPGFVNITGDSTLTNGVGTFNVGMKQAGTQTITATDTVNDSITGTSNDILVNPGPPAQVIVSAPATTNAGESFSFTATVTDLFGNLATSYSGTVHFTSSDAAAVLPADSVLTGGTGVFNATLNTTGAQTITATDTVTNALTGTSNGITVSIPSLVVTSTADSGTGTLRAVLATAVADGSANITFDPTIFATPQTITLTSGTLTIPSNTTITGATTGSGATLQNLVTVSGGGSSNNFSVFTVNSGVTGAAIHNLVIANGYIDTQGGGISNEGSLTVTNSTLENNYAAGYAGTGNGGGAIYNAGNAILTIAGSTFTGNISAPGGAILTDSTGQMTITNSTFSGNSAVIGKVGGAIFINRGTVSINGSTFSGNSATGGGGIYNYGTLTATNTIMAGNTGGDCGAGGANSCPANGANGNVIGVTTIAFTPLGNYGGPTQTLIPPPGSSAICAGLQADIPSGVTTDQRGLPNTNTSYPGYSAGAPCVDAGAVQTNYALNFTQQPSDTESGVSMLPAPAIALTESGNAFTASGVTIPLTLTGSGSLSGGSATTSAGVATYSSLKVSAAGSGDTLTATLSLNPNLSTPLSLPVTSSPFNVAPAPTATQVISSETLTFDQPSVSFTPVAGAGGSGTLSYGIAPALPAGLSFSMATGSITGTPTVVSPAASYTVTVTDANGATATASFSLTVNPATPTLNWAAPGSIAYGTPLSANQLDATASVSGTFVYNPPAGMVLPPGMHTLTATFTPAETTDYKTPQPVTVTLDVTSAKLIVTANSATRVYGAANPAFTGTVTGTVNGDSFTESFTTTATQSSPVNTYPIVPSVTGANLSDYTVAIHNGALTITQAASITTLTASNATITPGQNLTLTAQVKSATTGTPTGSVDFYDGSSLLNTATLANGTAAYTATTLGSGSHALTAVYSGDTNFTVSNSGTASTVTVGSFDFTISMSGASSQTVIPGSAVQYAVNVTPLYGMYPGPVNFSISGLPAGATGTFSPASIAANDGAETVSLTIQTGSASASNAISPLGRRLAPIAFGLLLLPFTGVRRLRISSRILRWMLCLALLLTGGAISAGVLSACGSSNGFLGQAPKNYTVTVTASSGTVQHTASVNLNLQ